MIEKTITDNAVSDLLRIALAHPVVTSFILKTRLVCPADQSK